MKIATWNVNSLRVRLAHVLQWLEQHQPDILGLQETKTEDHDFPADAFFDAGYEVRFSGQKTYNGVAFVFRQGGIDAQDLVTGFDGYADPQKRILGATFGDTRIYNLYVPNGQSVDSEKYHYKLQWLDALHKQIQQEAQRYRKMVLMGDFNIAPEDRDIHDADKWRGKIMCSDTERNKLRAILDLGFCDLFRQFENDTGHFSWWDYRMAAFRRKLGLRIDLILGSEGLSPGCTDCRIDTEPRALERPSDHAPVWADLKT